MNFSSVHLVNLELESTENFIVTLNPKKGKELNLKNDDYVQIIGRDLKETVCAVNLHGICIENEILMSRVIRHNLGVFVNDAVTVKPCPNITTGSCVWIGLMDCPAVRGLTQDFCIEILKHHFEGSVHTVFKGNKFIARGGMRAVEFIVIDIEPGPYCIVDKKTKINFKSIVQKYKKGEKTLSDIGYEDIGGQRFALEELRKIEFPLQFPNLFKEIKAMLPRMILFGPHGVGKVLMARALANETGANFVLIDGYNKNFSNAKIGLHTLVKKFEEAREKSPSVLCIDGLDVIAPENITREQDKIIMKVLIECVRNLGKQFIVVIIGVTSQLNEVNTAITELFSNSKMDKQIQFKIPDMNSRLQILDLLTRHMKHSEDLNLHYIAEMTENYTGAALADLCRKAASGQKKKEEFLLSIDEEMDDVKSVFAKTISDADFELYLGYMDSYSGENSLESS